MRWPVIRTFLCLFGLLALLSACSRESAENFASPRRGAPDEVFSDFVTEESDSGRLRWRLTAPKASKYKARNLIVMEKPKIEFYDERGELQTTLTSDTGEYFQDKQDMLAYGNVVVVSTEGDVLETDSLFWVGSEEKIVSNSFVKLTRGNDVITGLGIECDYNLSLVNIKRDVHARIIDEGGEVDE